MHNSGAAASLLLWELLLPLIQPAAQHRSSDHGHREPMPVTRQPTDPLPGCPAVRCLPALLTAPCRTADDHVCLQSIFVRPVPLSYRPACVTPFAP